MIRRIKKILAYLGSALNSGLNAKITRIEDNIQCMTIENLKQDKKYDNPKKLTKFGWKVYSQNEEDGIINEIFNRIGTTNKIFVEFGVGNGLENNTLVLLLSGWKGLWIEGNEKFYREIKNGFSRYINENRLKVNQCFITKSNINTVISSNITEKEIDLLSIDIDGNDIHIFETINVVSPRVVVIEYNGRFPASVKYCMKYNEVHHWDGTDNFGASLSYIEEVFKSKGYALVGCNITGTNAFFVKSGLADNLFLEPFNAENHFEPFRLSLIRKNQTYKTSYKTFENSSEL
jgi:hypothetical protein